MQTTNAIMYDMTLARIEAPDGIPVNGAKYHAFWNTLPSKVQKDSEYDRNRVLFEGIAKITECLQEDLRMPPAVRITLMAGEDEPRAIPVWKYGA